MTWYKPWKKNEGTARVAKDRLQIIVARERTACAEGLGLGYLPQLQQELLQVIAKYEKVDLDRVNVCVDKRGGTEVLELSIMLPDAAEPLPARRSRLAYV
jgi:cell division topological specificity factor